MNDPNTGKAGMSMIDSGPREHVGRFRLTWAAPAALALALGWPLEAPAECTSATGCLTTALDGLVGGFTGTAGGDLWGWMISGGHSAGTSAIGSDLQNIESTLDTIATELSEIEAELEQLQCGIDADFIAQYAGPIQSYYQTYADWLTDMQSGALPALADVSEWANCAVGLPTAGQSCQDSNILTLMDDINDTATAAAGSSGSIKHCIIANSGAPAADTLDDRSYYSDQVQPVTDWYFAINTQAMIVLTEAYHFRAWQAAGSPTSGSADEIISNVCPPGASAPYDGCIEPITKYGSLGSNTTGEFVPFVYGQFAAGGAPYSTDVYVMQNGTDYVLATSIESYTDAAGGGCGNGTLSSAAPCGVTVGTYYEPLESVSYGPYGYGAGGYGNWVTAPESLFNSLLDQGFNGGNPNNVGAGDFLCTMSLSGGDLSTCTQATSGAGNGGAGLKGIEPKILFFDQLVTPALLDQPVICFLDGGLWNGSSSQPFCAEDGTGRWNALFENTMARCDGNYSAIYDQSGVTESQVLPEFYQASICLTELDGQFSSDGWIFVPSYSPSKNEPVEQFRWPALDWTKLTCSDGSSASDAKNPAGVPTLCGNDFDRWFEAIVPPGPTTTTAIADTTLDAAAPNTNDGGGAQLELTGLRHGDTQVALLGFDPAELQAFLEAGPLDNARLVLTRADASSDQLESSRSLKRKKAEKIRLVLWPLNGEFVEGNGVADVAGEYPGIGSGATWNCAEDIDVGDDAADCLQEWDWDWDRGWGWGASLDGGRDEARYAFVPEGDAQSSRVGWDVTEDVRRGVYTWALQRASGSGSLAFVSREGAEALGDLGLAPTLILTHPVEEGLSLND